MEVCTWWALEVETAERLRAELVWEGKERFISVKHHHAARYLSLWSGMGYGARLPEREFQLCHGEAGRVTS